MDRPVIEPAIGSLLVASLHNSIAEMLPERLEFYEEWLKPSELRDGKMSRAPFGAVLSFRRREGPAYDTITARAGECTAEWWAADVSAVRKRLIRRAPAWARGRLALRAARTLTYRRGFGEPSWAAQMGSETCELRCAVPGPDGLVAGILVLNVTATVT